jgi:hypothetical protein
VADNVTSTIANPTLKQHVSESVFRCHQSM